MFKHLVLILIILLTTACEAPEHGISIEFSPVYDSKTVTCDSTITKDGVEWRLDQLQFYVHNIEVMDTEQLWHAAKIAEGASNSDRVALLGGVCGAALDWSVSLQTPIAQKDITKVRFKLGVPFELNHQNPLTQKSPLNQSDMFWVWQTGHKFLRLELNSNQHDWIYHLGSTGCSSPSAVRAPEAKCQYPNIVTVELDSNLSQPIQVNLSQFLAPVDLIKENNCKSSPANPNCQTLLKQTGIGSNQQLFSTL